MPLVTGKSLSTSYIKEYFLVRQSLYPRGEPVNGNYTVNDSNVLKAVIGTAAVFTVASVRSKSTYGIYR